MILIFGGAYQGKLAYALDRFNLTENDVSRCSSDDINMPVAKKIIYEVDKWILALIKKDADVEDAVRQFITAHKETIVICNDISCGVVPSDPVLRKWREAVGRALTVLSHNSDEVIRLFCGIQTRIK
jgi:adenosyl cobinamide kinase/adenosyl cobinamide phosphate guanylyltransferase